jgi:ribonucleoside-diphosphate reductase alpha chain
MPAWGSEHNNAENVEKNAATLLKYARRLRGFTVYPDGARGGQPLTPVPLDEAIASEGIVYEERETECVGGVCGI